MVNSVSRVSAVAQQDAASQQAAKPPAKPKDTQQPDTVVLSQQATQAAHDIDHDGDSH
jgi:hypothetical protein